MKFFFLFHFSFLLFGAISLPEDFKRFNLRTDKETLLSLQTNEKKGNVFVFVSEECPCSRSHEALLKDLYFDFGDFNFIAIRSGEKTDLASAQKHFKNSLLPFSIYFDENYELAKKFKALRTPHAFVLDSKNEILYRGAVANNRDAKKVTSFYLRTALLNIRERKTDFQKETEPMGCKIWN